MTLEQIAKKHKTTKWPHGFMPIYEKYFAGRRYQPMRLLEIGVDKGDSMKMWCEYFPDGHITGVDKHLIYESDDCELIEGDITLQDTQDKLIHSYDIIIDDGSHIAEEQLKAFSDLWYRLKPGGYYVIEDLFTLFDPVWNPTAVNIINMVSARMKNILTGGDSIQEVHYYGRNDINGIMFLRKRHEEFRIQPIDEFQNL